MDRNATSLAASGRRRKLNHNASLYTMTLPQVEGCQSRLGEHLFAATDM